MIKQLKQVEEFHTTFGVRVAKDIESVRNLPEEDWIKLLNRRKSLIQEESKELCNELEEDIDLANAAKEIADLIYVCYGTVLELGLQDKFEEVFNEVHRSNMSKLENGKPVYRADGKVIKGKDYSPANIDKILES